MRQWIFSWLQRIAVVVIIAFVAVYGGDIAVYKLRGSPQSKVTVSRYVTIPLKGNKQEFDSLGTIDVPCAASLFSQSGLATCWQLRRNANQGITP
jgi:hypothetical protein